MTGQIKMTLLILNTVHTDTETQQFGFANAAKCSQNKALIWQSLIPKIPGLGELNPGISGSRDPGINSLDITALHINPTVSLKSCM